MSGPVAVGSWIFFVDFQQPASWWVESWPIPNNGNGLRPMETNLDPCPFLLRLLELKNSHPPKNQKTSVNYTLEPAGFEKNYGVTSKLSIFICLLLAKRRPLCCRKTTAGATENQNSHSQHIPTMTLCLGSGLPAPLLMPDWRKLGVWAPWSMAE